MGLVDKIIKKKLIKVAQDLLEDAKAQLPVLLLKLKAILKIKLEELREIALKKYADKKAELAELVKKKIEEEKLILKEKAEKKLEEVKKLIKKNI